MTDKYNLHRWLFYLLGLLILALGITLNTKVGLGVTPIISVSFSISTIWNLNFGNTTLVLYGIFILIEMLLHTIRRPDNLKRLLITDLLQFPLSLIFTRFMNIFSEMIPELQTAYAGHFAGSLPGRLLFLLLAIVFTGVGAAMSLNMRIIPNPGDGIVQAISDNTGKTVGFTKNCFDLFNVCVTSFVGLLFVRQIVGIGLGTVLAVIGVGRVIAIFNHFCMKKMLDLAGIS